MGQFKEKTDQLSKPGNLSDQSKFQSLEKPTAALPLEAPIASSTVELTEEPSEFPVDSELSAMFEGSVSFEQQQGEGTVQKPTLADLISTLGKPDEPVSEYHQEVEPPKDDKQTIAEIENLTRDGSFTEIEDLVMKVRGKKETSH